MRTTNPFPSVEVPPEPSTLSYTDVVSFLRRYWPTILTVLAACVLGTYLTLSFLSEQFDTKASVIVRLGRENLDAPSDARNNVFSTGVRHEEVMSEIELVKSPALIEQVVQELGPDTFKPHRIVPSGLIARSKFYVKAGLRWGKERYKALLYTLGLQRKLSDRESAISELTNDLTITWLKETDVFEVSLRLGDPVLGERILTRLLNDYLVRRVDIRKGSGVTQFMQSERAELQRKLLEAEREENAWKSGQHVSSVKDELPLYLQRIRDLSAENDQTVRDSQTAIRQRDSLLGLLGNTPERVRQSQQDVPSPAVESYRQRLTVLQAERAELLNRYKEDSIVVTNKNEEINRLRSLIRNEQGTETAAVTISSNPVRQDLERRLHDEQIAISGLVGRHQAQRDQLEQLREQLKKFDTAGNHLRELERDRELLETQYLALAKRTEDADITGALDASHLSNVTILSPPWSDPTPAYPRKMLLMYAAIGAGLVLGFVLAGLLHAMDQQIHTAKDVLHVLDVPCLGVVPIEENA